MAVAGDYTGNLYFKYQEQEAGMWKMHDYGIRAVDANENGIGVSSDIHGTVKVWEIGEKPELLSENKI